MLKAFIAVTTLVLSSTGALAAEFPNIACGSITYLRKDASSGEYSRRMKMKNAELYHFNGSEVKFVEKKEAFELVLKPIEIENENEMVRTQALGRALLTYALLQMSEFSNDFFFCVKFPSESVEPGFPFFAHQGKSIEEALTALTAKLKP